MILVKDLIVNCCEKGAYNSSSLYDLHCFLDKNEVKNILDVEYINELEIQGIKELVINSSFVFCNVDIIINSDVDVIFIEKNDIIVCQIERIDNIFLEIEV